MTKWLWLLCAVATGSGAAPPADKPKMDIAAFMRGALNAAMSEVSLQLNHRWKAGTPPSEPLRAALKELERVSTQLVDQSTAEPLAYQVHAVQLQIAARGLQESVLTDQRANAGMFFQQVVATCTSCHASYKN